MLRVFRPDQIHVTRAFSSHAKSIFRDNGKTLVVPIDHGTFIPVPALGDAEKVIASLAPYADAFIANMGLVKHCHQAFGGKPILLRADIYRSHFALSEKVNDDDALNMYYGFGMADAMRVNASGVISMMFPGNPNEKEITQNCCRLVSEALHVKMPVMIEAVPFGLGMPEKYTPDNIDYVVRAAAELGADVVKTPFTDRESFAKTVQQCPVPVVILGGAHQGSTIAVLKMVEDSIAAGGSGVAIGRQLWQDSKPVAMIKALSAVIHDDATAEEAMGMYEAEE